MPDEVHDTPDILRVILVARDRAVLLDVDLATLYGVNTGSLNQAVKRNLERFPSDFAFRLTSRELIGLSKLAGSSEALKTRNLRKPPVAFTEHGAIMLAMVLKSPRAIQMSVHVVRAFAHLRSAVRANEQVMRQLEQLETRVAKRDARTHRSREDSLARNRFSSGYQVVARGLSQFVTASTIRCPMLLLLAQRRERRHRHARSPPVRDTSRRLRPCPIGHQRSSSSPTATASPSSKSSAPNSTP